MTLAEQIKEAREAAGLTQRELDEKGRFGFGFTKKLEAGEVGIGEKRLARMSETLGVQLTPDAPGAPAAPPPHVARGEVAPAPPGGLPPSEDEPARRRGLFARLRGRPEPTDDAPGTPPVPRPPKPPRRRWWTNDPAASRQSAADDFGDLFEWGAELVGPDHVPTARMLAFESPIAGFMLDDAVNGTVVDRVAVQPLVKARGRFDLVFAVVLPPLLTLRIESAQRDFAVAARRGDEVAAAHAAASAQGGMRMLRSTLRRSFPLMAPAIKKARAREKEAAAALDELLDDETMQALGISIRDGVPVDANGKKVDAGDVMLQFLFSDFVIQLPDEEVPTDARADGSPPGDDTRGNGATPFDPGRPVDGAGVQASG